MLCWVHEQVAICSPYLVATSVTVGAGKTTLLKLLEQLTPRPFSCGSATAAAIFRLVDAMRPITLLCDNVDTLFKRKPDVTELFSLAHTRGVKIPRTEKVRGELVTRWFDPFCPKACTLVGTNMPDALQSRSIFIELWKMKQGETVERISQFNLELMDSFKTLRRKLQRWANDHAEALQTARPTMPPAFLNRPADLWILIWAVADTADGEWGQLARNAAERLSEQDIVEPTWLERLAEELWIAFCEKGLDRIPSEALVKQMTADELSVWHDYGRGHTVTQREIAALARKLRIHPRGIAIGKRRVKGYYAADFFQKEIFERILARDPLPRSRPKPQPKSSKSRKHK